MNHPIAFVFVASVEIVIANIEKLFDVVRQFVEERVSVPDFIENHQWKLVGPRGRHIGLGGEQWAWNGNVIGADLVSHYSRRLTESRSFGKLLSCDDDRRARDLAVNDQEPIGHRVTRQIVVMRFVLDLMCDEKSINSGRRQEISSTYVLLGERWA